MWDLANCDEKSVSGGPQNQRRQNHQYFDPRALQVRILQQYVRHEIPSKVKARDVSAGVLAGTAVSKKMTFGVAK